MGRHRPVGSWTASRKRILGILHKKRITPTNAQRLAFREAFKQREGYYPAKLSDVVKKPGNYTVTGRDVKYRTIETKRIPGEIRIVGWKKDTWGWEDKPIYESDPDTIVVVRSNPIGETLKFRKHSKKGGSGKSGGSGERGSHKSGSMVAKKAQAKLGGTRGMRPGREKKKKKKTIIG